MSMTSPDQIEMSPTQQQQLGTWSGPAAQPSSWPQRARIVLLAAQGWTNTRIAALRRGVRGHRSQVAPPLVGRAGYGVVG